MPRSRPHSQIPLAALALATAFVQTACKTDDEDELGDIGRLYLDFIDLAGAGYMLYCECAVEAGYYDSVELCVGPALPPPLAECTAAVLDDFSNAAPHLECVVAAYSDYADCLEAAGCDGDTYACYSMLYPSLVDCPEIPYDAQRAISLQCYGKLLPEPFTCADGTQIPETWECDDEADCEDGSDEQNC